MFARWISAMLMAHFIFPSVALAQDFTSSLDNAGTAVYGTPDNANFFETLGTILSIVLSFLGVVLLLLVIYAGFLWMTAAGNDSQVAKAKNILVNSVIGMIILISAYAISAFVVNQLSSVV